MAVQAVNQIRGLRQTLDPRLFVLGDSFSTIRRSGTESAANLNINGRFVANQPGYNLWDYLRVGFPKQLNTGLTNNYCREGAMAFQNWRTTAAWSAINPIPSVGSQMDTLITDNPLGSISSSDVLGILIGTNDKVSSADVNAADGSPKPTATQVSTAIVNVVNRAITHGFRNIIVMHPEGKWFSTVSPLLFPALVTVQVSNRNCKIVQCYADTAMLLFDNPYHADGLHPNDIAHKALGEVLRNTWEQNQIIDRTQSVYVSSKGSSSTNIRELGFNFFNPNTDGVRLRMVDQFNCFEAILNRRMTLRSYNGLVLKGASEANAFTAPVGGGRNDPCLTIGMEFWEHQSGLLIDNVANSPAPMILGRLGGVDRFKVGADGGVTIAGTGQLKIDNPSRILVSRNTNQTITYPTANAFAIVVYASSSEDPYSQFSTSTGRFTIKSENAGFYFFNASVTVALTTVRNYYIGLFRNGTEVARLLDLMSSGVTFPTLVGSTFIYGSSGDIFDIRIGSSATGNFDILGNAGLSFFRAIKIS